MNSGQPSHPIFVRDITPNDWNPNRMPAARFAALKENIRRHGFTGALLVRPLANQARTDGQRPFRYEIVDGEQRFKAVSELGYRTVPCVIVEATDAEAKAQTLAMNRLRGHMQANSVRALLEELAASPVDFGAFTGYQPQAPPPTVPEAWKLITLSVPADVADAFDEEIERLKGVTGFNDKHLALEVMVALSAQTPAENVMGEEVAA